MRARIALFLLLLTLPARADQRADAPRAPRGPVPPAEMQADDDRLRAALPGKAAPTDPRDGIRREEDELDPQGMEYARRALSQKAPLPEIGGDDVYVRDLDYIDSVEIDVTEDGTIYMAIGYNPSEPFGEYLDVRRSLDGGTTWSVVGTFTSGGTEYDRLYDLNVFEGTQSKVYVTYMHYNSTRGGFDMRVSSAPLSSGALTWTTRTVMDTAGVSFLGPDLASDSAAYDVYYLYAVCAGLDGNGDDIFFSRSTDYGLSWSAPYRIAELVTSGNLMYSRPYVAYGNGGTVQVAWTYTERLQSTFDDAVRFKRAVNFASASTDWDAFQWALYPTNDGINQVTRELVSRSSAPLTALFASEWINAYGPRVWSSNDGGATWEYFYDVTLPFSQSADAVLDATNARIVAFGRYNTVELSEMAFSEAPLSNLRTGWTALQSFSTAAGYAISSPSIAVDPSRGNRVAVGWQGWALADYQACFDAQWRSDEGYPNYDPGFPVAIPTESGQTARHRTAPAIAQIDGDPYDEIVFGDVDGNVYVVSHQGTIPGGWPRDIGAIDVDAPVAVGDLDGDGKNEIVAGSTTGLVYSYDAQGNLHDGFPVDLGTGAATFVSIGAAGPFYPNWILALSGNRVVRINYRGVVQQYSGTLSGTATSPAAIGDVDEDGEPEIVYNFAYTSGGSFVHVRGADPATSTVEQFRWFATDSASGPVSLADLDGDGDLEIAHPTTTGKVFVLQHDMADVAGFPYDSGAVNPISQVAFDQILGNFQPELMFSSRDYRVHVVYGSGVSQTNFPATVGSGWFLYGTPIAAPVLGANNWVVVGSRDSKGYALRNVGAVLPAGWPKGFADQIEVTAATGDVDKDGRSELVFLGNNALHMVDVGIAPTAVGLLSWPMHGANPRRTSCMDCVEDQVTPAPESASSRVSFRIASANPASGPVSFAATLPEGGVMSLEIFDARGRRARLVSRSEVSAGTHALIFDGKDGDGARLARGSYFARLTIDAGRGAQSLVRRITLID